MDDRIAEIREALEWYDSVFLALDHLDPSAPRRMKHLAAAARDHIALLDSDALIIRRDENGNWPEWAMAQVHAWDMTGDNPMVLFDLLHTHYNDPDKWASSQGVEPQ